LAKCQSSSAHHSLTINIATVKNLLLALAIVAISVAAHAQQSTMNKKMIWSIGVQPSIPIGEFTAYSGFGLGGSFQGEYKPSRVGITLNAGFIDYFGKTVNNIKYADFSYIPVLAGLKYYMSSKSYLHAQVGPGFGTNGLGTSFWYGAGIGLNFSRTVDAEFGYMGWKQSIVNGSGSTGGGYTGGTTGTTGGTGGTGGGYGGHYPTLGLRLGFSF
jgi:hypothetical protein